MAKPTRSYQLPPSLALPHPGPDVLHLNRRQEKLNEGSSSPAALALPSLGETSGCLTGSQDAPSQPGVDVSCCSEPVGVLAELGGGRASSFLTVLSGSPCSDSDEEESTKEDNTVLLRFHLKYEADILFTRWARAPGEGRCGRSDAYDEAPSGGT